MMLDPTLTAAADALSVPLDAIDTWESSGVHDFSTLGSDLVHTAIYAAVGLVGAYVTQVSDAAFFS